MVSKTRSRHGDDETFSAFNEPMDGYRPKKKLKPWQKFARGMQGRKLKTPGEPMK